MVNYSRFQASLGQYIARVSKLVIIFVIDVNVVLVILSQALDMIKDLQAAFNELLDDLDWMDENTKRVAKEKVSGSCI